MKARSARHPSWLPVALLLALVALAWVPVPAQTPATSDQTPSAPAAPPQTPAPAPAPLAPGKPQDKNQIFRSTVDIVSLNVTVIDNQNRYITDIGEKEFSVFEDGVKQELSFFNRTSLPIAMSLLI